MIFFCLRIAGHTKPSQRQAQVYGQCTFSYFLGLGPNHSFLQTTCNKKQDIISQDLTIFFVPATSLGPLKVSSNSAVFLPSYPSTFLSLLMTKLLTSLLLQTKDFYILCPLAFFPVPPASFFSSFLYTHSAVLSNNNFLRVFTCTLNN